MLDAMDEYNKLQQCLAANECRLIQVVAIPRSVCTACARALSCAHPRGLLLNEPFSRDRRDESTAFANISEYIETVRPKLLVIKNLAKHLPPESFIKLARLSSGIVWCIRDPYVQFASLLTRMQNDAEHFEGADIIEQSALRYDQLEKLSDELEGQSGFERGSWQAIASLKTMYDTQFLEPQIVIDGDNLAKNPLATLRRATKALSIDFRPQMINGWDAEAVHMGHTNARAEKYGLEHSGWIGRALTATDWGDNKRIALRPDALPPALRGHIETVALPIYRSMSEH